MYFYANIVCDYVLNSSTALENNNVGYTTFYTSSIASPYTLLNKLNFNEASEARKVHRVRSCMLYNNNVES